MSNAVVRRVVRTLFTMTPAAKAGRWAHDAVTGYTRLAAQLDDDQGVRPVHVPPMRGVDEDMRGWSFFQIVEHNVIVCRCVSAIISQLARGEQLHGAAVIDPKHDVMPGPSPGRDQVDALAKAVQDHLAAIHELGRLRGTATSPHPLFGPFDAHKWHCMFGFHLRLHLPQAEAVAREVKGSPMP